MLCKKCGNEEPNEAMFCSVCGAGLEPEPEVEEKPAEELESVCSGCGYLFGVENQQFCPKCGKKRKIKMHNCPFCNAPILNQDDVFCSVCGKKYEQQSIADKVKDNELLKTVGEDIKNSKSLQKIKQSVDNGINKINKNDKNSKKKIGIAAAIIVPVLIILIVVLNIHVCDDCGETYFGARNKESFWGETYYVCDDCYDFYW